MKPRYTFKSTNEEEKLLVYFDNNPSILRDVTTRISLHKLQFLFTNISYLNVKLF